MSILRYRDFHYNSGIEEELKRRKEVRRQEKFG